MAGSRELVRKGALHGTERCFGIVNGRFDVQASHDGGDGREPVGNGGVRSIERVAISTGGDDDSQRVVDHLAHRLVRIRRAPRRKPPIVDLGHGRVVDLIHDPARDERVWVRLDSLNPAIEGLRRDQAVELTSGPEDVRRARRVVSPGFAREAVARELRVDGAQSTPEHARELSTIVGGLLGVVGEGGVADGAEGKGRRSSRVPVQHPLVCELASDGRDAVDVERSVEGSSGVQEGLDEFADVVLDDVRGRGEVELERPLLHRDGRFETSRRVESGQLSVRRREPSASLRCERNVFGPARQRAFQGQNRVQIRIDAKRA